MIYSIVTLPNSTGLLADTSVWAGSFFDSFLVVGLALAGLAIGGMIIHWLGCTIKNAMGYLLEHLGGSGKDNYGEPDYISVRYKQ